MKNFTIENETNNITVHGSAKEAEAVPNSERFSSEAALAKLAANWPAARLAEIWNSLPGETQVKKFKDRANAVSRIWKAIQTLGETVPAERAEPQEEAPHDSEPNSAKTTKHIDLLVAQRDGKLKAEQADAADQQASETAQPEAVIAESTEPAVATDVAPQSPDVASSEPGAKKKATRSKKAPVATNAKDAGAAREGSKTSQVIAMLKREGGTTLEESYLKWRGKFWPQIAVSEKAGTAAEKEDAALSRCEPPEIDIAPPGNWPQSLADLAAEVGKMSR